MLRSAQRINSSTPVQCAPSEAPRHTFASLPCVLPEAPRRPPLFFFSRSTSDIGHGSDQAGVRPHGAPARSTTARGSLFFNLFTLMRPATFCPPRHMALVPQNHADGACCLTLPSCVFSDGAQILWRQGAQQAADQGGPFESAASPGRA